MLKSPNKGETAVHGCPYPLGMVMRIPDVLAVLWVGVYVPLALSLYFFFRVIFTYAIELFDIKLL